MSFRSLKNLNKSLIVCVALCSILSDGMTFASSRGNFFMIKKHFEGKKFNRWTILKVYKKNKTKILCICECGTKKMVLLDNVVRGLSRSCGCYMRESFSKNSKHPVGHAFPQLTLKNPAYYAIHRWMSAHYGRPQECENKKCLRLSKTFHWALKRGMSHAKNRTHYRRLCRKCHSVYDLTPENKKIFEKNVKKASESNHIRIVQYDSNMKKIAEYKSVKQARILSGESRWAIDAEIRGEKKSFTNSIWRREKKTC